jgi:hypothetical protein
MSQRVQLSREYAVAHDPFIGLAAPGSTDLQWSGPVLSCLPALEGSAT